MPHKVGNGAILGIVSEDGVPAKKRITLMDRSNLSVVQTAESDESGAYAFTGLNPDTNDYIVFTVDDDGVEKKAAIMYDYIKPIPAHQGGFFWGNWYRVSTKKEPACSIIAITDTTDAAKYSLPYGAGYDATKTYGNSISVNELSITPAALNIPRATLINSSLHRKPINHKGMFTSNNPIKLSFEWVLDLSAPFSGEVCLSLVRYFLENADYLFKTSLMIVAYDPSTRTVTMFRQNSPYGNSGAINATYSTSMVAVVSYVIPSELAIGGVHISGSLEYGVSATIFINGVIAATASLAGTLVQVTPDKVNNITFTVGSRNVASAADLTTNTATLSFSLATLYADTMSEQESLALYNALFIDSIPTATGYMKSVLSDYPFYLYRLHDNNENSVVIDSLRPDAITGNWSTLAKANASMLSKNSSSLVVGGSGYQFSGGALLGSGLFGSPKSKNFITVDFMAKPDASPLTNKQILLSHANNTSTIFFQVIRSETTGAFGLEWRELSGVVTVYFSHTIDTSMIKHYGFTVDKLSGVAILYVNGNVIETLTITTLPMVGSGSPGVPYEYMCIGGLPNTALTIVTQPYYGYLAEVAMYPAALSQAAIQAHYEARLTI